MQLHKLKNDLKNNCRNFLLFLVPAKKNDYDFDLSFHSEAIAQIKKNFQDEIFLWADVCLCSLTTHGHCCLFNEKQKIDNEKSLQALSKIALTYADAGIDGVAPSDMMDGRTKAIRSSLDSKNYDLIPLMSYSSKFASNFYGPFRDAADSAPSFGNRKNYQLDYRNKNDALRASRRCAQEGADLLMVKPGLYSLDLIKPIKKQTGLMVGAYQVAGNMQGLHCLQKKIY